MFNSLLLPAVKSQTKSLNLSCKKLDDIPSSIEYIKFVTNLNLRNNNLRDLPDEFKELKKVEILNLAHNQFKDIPHVLQKCPNLKTLQLFCNSIQKINPEILNSFKNLSILNLNKNKLTCLPKTIFQLECLRILSLNDNEIRELPYEICALTQLEELHLARNKLQALPLQIGNLGKLEKLFLLHNNLKELPESIGYCQNLRVLDVAANDIFIFPTEFFSLPLEEFYFEENELLNYTLVHSQQEEEVLSLKELSARYVMKDLKIRNSYTRNSIKNYPTIRSMLSRASKCYVCGGGFLNTWLECVQFVNVSQMCKKKQMKDKIPVRSLVCSYKCFNTKGHDLLGVAFP